MRWSAWLRGLWALVKRVYPALAVMLVVAALAATFYGISQARAHARSSAGASATATSSVTTAFATATLPPLSGPTPTPPSGPQPAVPSNGTAPFIVQAVTTVPNCPSSPGCDLKWTCSPGPTNFFDIYGYAWLPKNAPDGYITYRWHLSDGTITAPAVAHYSWNDQYGQNLIIYHYILDPAQANGSPFSARLEIMKPNEMISLPSANYTVTCLPSITAVNAGPTGANARIYDCAVGGTQSFPYTATVGIAPSPSYSISYYWKRSDGSVTPTRTVTTKAGATSVTLGGDSITLGPPPAASPTAPSPIATYYDTVVVLNPPSAVNASSVKQFEAQGQDVLMPNCSAYTPTPTPTQAPAPTSTATSIPTATATP